ncbi:MAG: hypothetical protein ACON4T_00570 [Synechococcus sp.]
MSTTSSETRALSTAEQERLEELLAELTCLANDLRGNPEALLMLLRSLEALHRNIQDDAFRCSLPENRQHLFTLLQTMERSGGWPYIPRLQLKTFIAMLDQPPADMAA